MMESRITRNGEEIRPAWNHTHKDWDSYQLEMLESIRNTLEGILKVLQESEIVYMRGKDKGNG